MARQVPATPQHDPKAGSRSKAGWPGDRLVTGLPNLL
jgi:hypothetical protein